jgi:hypothetical protein
VLDDVAHDAPEVRVPAGLYRTARRAHRRRLRWSAAAVAIAVLVVSGYAVASARWTGQVAAGGRPGLPSRVVNPPLWTETVQRSPAGPASVAFTAGKGTVQSDYDDVKLEWWRDGHTAATSVVVGLQSDTYRVARGVYWVGTELSPDGRYLLTGEGMIEDLATGEVRPVPNLDKNAWGAWSADGHRIIGTGNAAMTVLAWPSAQVEWRLRLPAAPAGGADPYFFPHGKALSPDGSLAAVENDGRLSVYRRDGTPLWSQRMGHDQVAGRAAWRADGRLAVLRRGDATCPACPQRMSPYPSDWRLSFVDGSTGAAVTAPAYPPVRSALDVRVVAWRGDVAYAIIRYSNGRTDTWGVDVGRVELVRLTPGAAEPHTMLTAPDGTQDMNVAADYVDTPRPVGSPQNGVNTREIFGWAITTAPITAPFGATWLVLAVWLFRRRRRRRPATAR